MWFIKVSDPLGFSFCHVEGHAVLYASVCNMYLYRSHTDTGQSLNKSAWKTQGKKACEDHLEQKAEREGL